MFQRFLFSMALAVTLATLVLSQEMPQPKQTPVPTSDRHKAIIHQGIMLHERGDFDSAIRAYEEVLKENPDDTVALYEMAFAYFAKHDYKKSLEIGYRGAKYKSDELAGFYVLIGNNLDLLGQAEAAMKVYRAAIKQFPDDAILHFNFAVALINQNKEDEARKELKESVSLNPDYASSHFGLGNLFFKGGYRIPALLAMSRFLVLEPRSNRSSAALQVISDLLGKSATRDEKTGDVKVVFDTAAKIDEGDFNSAMVLLGILGAARLIEKKEGKSEIQMIAQTFDMLFETLANSDKKQKGFAWDYYRPYFIEMKRRGLVEPFCYHIYRSSQSAEVQKWLSDNAAKVGEFVTWSKSYEWPRIR